MQGKGRSSSARQPRLEKGTVHRAYYVNIDGNLNVIACVTRVKDQVLSFAADFNTLKSHRELKLWLKKQVVPYGIKVVDLSSSWSNGMALCALIHRYRPDLMYVDKTVCLLHNKL